MKSNLFQKFGFKNSPTTPKASAYLVKKFREIAASGSLSIAKQLPNRRYPQDSVAGPSNHQLRARFALYPLAKHNPQNTDVPVQESKKPSKFNLLSQCFGLLRKFNFAGGSSLQRVALLAVGFILANATHLVPRCKLVVLI